MYSTDSPAGYTFADIGANGFVDVLDHAGNVLAMNVSPGDAWAMVERWDTGTSNPYLEALDKQLLAG